MTPFWYPTSATCPVRCVLSSIKPAVCGRPVALYGKIASVFSSFQYAAARNKPTSTRRTMALHGMIIIVPIGYGARSYSISQVRGGTHMAHHHRRRRRLAAAERGRVSHCPLSG